MGRAAHARSRRDLRDCAHHGRIYANNLEATVQSAPPKISDFAARLLARCLDIRSVWSIDCAGPDKAPEPGCRELLVFADQRTLEQLRKCDDLRRDDVEVLVVIDGDRFENVWGPRKLSGSLVRWAWREVSSDQAFYDESRWAEGSAAAGRVVRVRRKATLLWRSPTALAA
jgi:hypothetical protein